MEPTELAARVADVRERIERARERAGRAEPVTLVAVTKTHPAQTVADAIAAGLTDVGENRVQELEEKVAEVGRDSVRWHLIGHLQRNKADKALPLFDLMHSVDSLRLAEAVSAAAVKQGREAAVLVQVNTSGEGTKGGFAAEAALDAAGRICELPGLRVEGMMTMAPLTDDEAVIRRTFAAARALWERAGREVTGFRATHLSMGMSNDFEAAVEEGSTLVRVGSVLFGERGR
ncbi:MAG TPA: YggS family pyridoxal phosphate-dependent enzyme [Longimicrobiaceae bacterium]|jgi:pyridoxal phosphate enzyme (YggS family)|nr:YggS family pyridoxal phosphate-dependent enzyme [Longimicrobiaceae bacterium]